MSGDDTFDNPLLGENDQDLKIAPKRIFRVVRPGREDLIIEAHAIDRDGTAVGFVDLEMMGKQPVPRLRWLIISPDMQIEEMVQFNTTSSRILS